jgi:hypothetical protein
MLTKYLHITHLNKAKAASFSLDVGGSVAMMDI